MTSEEKRVKESEARQSKSTKVRKCKAAPCGSTLLQHRAKGRADIMGSNGSNIEAAGIGAASTGGKAAIMGIAITVIDISGVGIYIYVSYAHPSEPHV